MEESQATEEQKHDLCLETKQAKLEEKASLLVQKISEIANENLELKDRLYKQKELYLRHERKIRLLNKEKTKLGIQLKSTQSSISERANTVKTLSHEIHNLKTLVRYLLSHEFTKFYYASYHLFMFSKVFLFANLKKPSWDNVKAPLVQNLKALKTLFLAPIKLRQIYYYRKLKRESPLSENFQENCDPSRVSLQMKRDLRKSWMLKQLVAKENFLTKNFPAYIPERLEGLDKKEVKIACILDEFSYQCFSYEANFIQLDFESWAEQIEENSFDLLFIESAWKGKNLQWKDQIGGCDHSKGSVLSRLVQTFKDKKIPTVFWNKEDPPHFKYFLEATKLFDHVFTSCENKIPSYEEALGHKKIQSLSFACQPVIHNPIGSCEKKVGPIAFAGSWHENRHEKRKVDMHNLLRPALDRGLHIFDRMADHLLDNYIFPFEYQSSIQGFLPYERMLKAYRSYQIFLNVNSVQNSQTMFSRRVYELMACGTNVISGPTKGFIFNFGQNLVCESQSENQTEEHLETLLNNPEEARRIAHKATRKVLKEHTYKNRLESILRTAGIKTPTQTKEKSYLVFLNLKNRETLEKQLDSFEQQTPPNKSLYIFVKRRQELEALKITLESYQNPNIFLIGGKDTVSFYEEAMNLIPRLNSDFVSCFDQESYYGPHFLEDLSLTFLYTNTQIASKRTSYFFEEKSQNLYEKNSSKEHSFSEKFNEKAFLATGSIFEDPLFREEILFNKRKMGEALKNLEYDIYHSDKYNFLESGCLDEKKKEEQNLSFIQTVTQKEEAEAFTDL